MSCAKERVRPTTGERERNCDAEECEVDVALRESLLHECKRNEHIHRKEDGEGSYERAEDERDAAKELHETHDPCGKCRRRDAEGREDAREPFNTHCRRAAAEYLTPSMDEEDESCGDAEHEERDVCARAAAPIAVARGEAH